MEPAKKTQYCKMWWCLHRYEKPHEHGWYETKKQKDLDNAKIWGHTSVCYTDMFSIPGWTKYERWDLKKETVRYEMTKTGDPAPF